MSTLTETQARDYLHTVLGERCRRGGHDLFIAHDFPPSMTPHGRLQPLDPRRLSGEDTAQLARALMNGRRREEFARALESNFAIEVTAVARFRVKAFVQQQVGLVLHTIPEQVPTLAQLQRLDALQAAVEVLVNVPAIAERIAKGEFHELMTIVSRSRELGMRTFNWALFDLYNQGLVSYEETLRKADSVNELRLNIKLKSARGEPAIGSGMTLTIDATPAEQLEAERRAELQRQARRRREFEDEQLARMQREKALRALAADGLSTPA